MDSTSAEHAHPQPRARAGLAIDAELDEFVTTILPRAGIGSDAFWHGVAAIIAEFAPRNRDLLERRSTLQAKIDDWHRSNPEFDADRYRGFLVEIGYLEPEGPTFRIETADVAPEISTIAGPQLVVPVSNARYAINAANARWGSLYDAVYGTDVLGDLPPAGGYDAARGARVIACVRELLDTVLPLAGGRHADVRRYAVADGRLVAELQGGGRTSADPSVELVGWDGAPEAPSAIVCRHHRLGVEIVVDPHSAVGRADPAGVNDVRLESAVTVIMDCEDSVAAVDGADKAVVYRNWYGLLAGSLEASVAKGATAFVRRLAADRAVQTPDGGTSLVTGRALMLVRNVGLLMTTSAVRTEAGEAIPEGILDAVMTVLCAAAAGDGPPASVYVVKPKLHGPDEVRFTVDLFAAVEHLLGLAPDTVKLGVMDEERRTTLNLAECIRAARRRIVFINTGFLDRTGDEIHTSMLAGPMVRKSDMKSQPWIDAYERHNVETGLACGFRGRAQIGKGMWAAPDLMGDMLATKGAQPAAGANCAWVPSPTAATLHAVHYHQVDVATRQAELERTLARDGRSATIDDLLVIPVDRDRGWSAAEIQAELDNNAQGILGYVVRWVDQGVGCSKVPDIHDIGLMEDRATCRISSQHIANWLHHGVVTPAQVVATMRRMAAVVDRQNAGDPAYRPMGPGFDGHAFTAACELVLSGTEQPSGYTEPILHARRIAAKESR